MVNFEPPSFDPNRQFEDFEPEAIADKDLNAALFSDLLPELTLYPPVEVSEAIAASNLDLVSLLIEFPSADYFKLIVEGVANISSEL